MGLRERRGDFLCSGPSFGTSELGFSEEIWSGLRLNVQDMCLMGDGQIWGRSIVDCISFFVSFW